MKVLWTVNIMMPEFARALGLPVPSGGGWLSGLLSAIRKYLPDMELTIVCAGECEVERTIGGVRYVCLGRMYDGKRYASRFLSGLSRVVEDFNPQVVHIHGTECGFAEIPQECWKGKPVVVSLQGVMSGLAPHCYGDLLLPDLAPYRNLIHTWITGVTVWRSARRWREREENEKRALSNIRYVFGRTQWDESWARALAPEARYFHVGEILRDEFYRGLRDESKVVRHSIYCGAALSYPLKGGHWLLKAIAILKRDFPDIQLRVAAADRYKQLAGLLSPFRLTDYKKYVLSLLQELDIEKNVVLLPSLSAAEVREELVKAEVYCLPSLCENSPNSLAEAMMTGAPAVVTCVGGVPSMVTASEAVMVPSGDAAALADGMRTVFLDRVRAHALCQEAHRAAVSAFSPGRVCAELAGAYQAILG